MTDLAWTILRLALTAVILAWLARDLDGPAAMAALSGFSSPAVALAVVLVAADRVLMYLRWRLLIRPFTTFPERGLVRIFFVSSFLGSFLPAGVGGDAARAYAVSREDGATGAAVASVVVDRWLGLLAVGVSGCVGLAVAPPGLGERLSQVMVGVTVLLAAGTVAGWHGERVMAGLMPGRLRHTWPGRMATRLAAAVSEYRRHPGAVTRVAALSLVVQVNRIVLAWLIGLSLGIVLPFGYYWSFMPLNILVILIPVSLGGFGLPQGAMVWTLGPFGVPHTEAFLLSTLFVGAGLVGSLPGAWMFVAGWARGAAGATAREARR